VELRLAHLYPELMNTYGDRGNVLALVRRAEWRDITLRVEGLGLGDRLDPGAHDLYFFGGGQDREQGVVAADLAEYKGGPLRDAVEDGAVVLAICGGYQLLGREFRLGSGAVLPGLGILDAWTVAGQRRNIGNTVVRCDWAGPEGLLVGFENHSGRTYLGPGCQALGRVEVGAGNNGEDGSEGAMYRDVYACYLHGSLLPKNPWFADHLLRRALVRRYGADAPFPALDDRLEAAARRAVLERVRKIGRAALGVR